MSTPPSRDSKLSQAGEPHAIPETIGAFAITPSNNLQAAIPFWERLGFAQTGGDANYIIMTGWSCELDLTQAGTGPWSVPDQNNPSASSSAPRK